MLTKKLEAERNCAFEVTVRYPLGTICLLLDMLNCGTTLENSKTVLLENDLTEESLKLVNNEQLMLLMERQHNQISDIQTVTRILCALIFHRVPKNLVSDAEKQNCA